MTLKKSKRFCIITGSGIVLAISGSMPGWLSRCCVFSLRPGGLWVVMMLERDPSASVLVGYPRPPNGN